MHSTSDQTHSDNQDKSYNSKQLLHNIVLVLIGVLSLIALSYPFACWRVSQQDKFGGLHVKTRTQLDRVNQN
jgi:hypothetical protein